MKLPKDRGLGWVEWILIIILALMILITAYLLLEPSLSILIRRFFESLQS